MTSKLVSLFTFKHSTHTSKPSEKLILKMDHVSTDFSTPKKQTKSIFCCEKSLLEALPQEIWVKILCGVEHDDLKSIVCVSKQIQEAALIAKKQHFEYITPRPFRHPFNLTSPDFEEIQAPRVKRRRFNLDAMFVPLSAMSSLD